MPLHDIRYQHWDGVHLGVWSRRWAIAQNGLTACLRNRFMRYVVMVCWLQALLMAGLLFMVGQLLVADSVINHWIGNFNPSLKMFAQLLTTWMEQHPEVSVHTTQNLLFYWFCTRLLRSGFFMLGMVIPLLFTRDLASNAIIIYSSKAVSRWDYLIGKFSTAFGMLMLTWLGPICTAWLVGNLLAPDWRFFWHARVALFHSLAFGLCCMCLLSLLAMGASAISTREKSTAALWYIWWSLSWFVEEIARHSQSWLLHLSLSYNLRQIALGIFHLGDDLRSAQANIPVFDQVFRSLDARTVLAITDPAIHSAFLTLLVLSAAAAWIIHLRVKPE